ncbi:MAG: hypothetical protein R3B45_07625 [Bdellovibrionota bacterium]
MHRKCCEELRELLIETCEKVCFIIGDDEESVCQINLLYSILGTRKLMNAEVAKQSIFVGEMILCTKVEYERDVRSAILDQIMRCQDVGDDRQEMFARAELRRLDRQFFV